MTFTGSWRACMNRLHSGLCTHVIPSHYSDLYNINWYAHAGVLRVVYRDGEDTLSGNDINSNKNGRFRCLVE